MAGLSKKEYQREWQRNMRRKFAAEHGYSTSANYSTGKLRKAVLERDGYRCVQCGMTDQEHVAKWGANRHITVDHKDKNRRNNTLANLQTLCLSCHGRKDLIPRLKQLRIPEYQGFIIDLRKAGLTYQAIADITDFSLTGIWKWCQKWGV